MILATKPKFRNPFKITSSPFLIQVYRLMYDGGGGITREAIGQGSFFHTIKKKLFNFFWLMYPFESRGELTLKKQHHGAVAASFNAKNTQFHALYLTRYRHGYEPEVASFIDAVLPDDGVFYDVGANWGYFSFFCATKPDFRGRVFAFEPFVSVFEDFKEIIAATGLEHAITAFNLAVSEHSGQGTMELPDGIHSGLATLTKRGSSQKKETRIISLDSFYHRLQPPSIIKIDAEGSEMDILKGASDVISSSRPMIIFENWTDITKPQESLRPLSFLSERGYFFFNPAWIVDSSIIPGNRALFMPGEKKLILKQFFAEERLLFSEKINCIACPKERVAEYLKSFHEIKLA